MVAAKLALFVTLLGSASALRMGSQRGVSSEEKSNAKLFCFAWTNGSPSELAALPEVEKQFAQCDGYAFYTDKDASSALDGVKNLVRVDVPSQESATTLPGGPEGRKNRDGARWLYHKNMAGLMPAWSHLLQDSGAESYDFIINTELDHYMRAREVKTTIASWMEQVKSEVDEGTPLMLNFGNAFIFNKGMVKEMKSKWSELNQIKASGDGAGCPTRFAHGSDTCEQDISYIKMANLLQVKSLGSSGCGKPPKARKGLKGNGAIFASLRLPCWDFQQMGTLVAMDGEKQKELLSTIAASEAEVHPAKPSETQMARREGDKEKWESFTPDKHIAIIHHMADASVHQFAAHVLP